MDPKHTQANSSIPNIPLVDLYCILYCMSSTDFPEFILIIDLLVMLFLLGKVSFYFGKLRFTNREDPIACLPLEAS